MQEKRILKLCCAVLMISLSACEYEDDFPAGVGVGYRKSRTCRFMKTRFSRCQTISMMSTKDVRLRLRRK